MAHCSAPVEVPAAPLEARGFRRVEAQGITAWVWPQRAMFYAAHDMAALCVAGDDPGIVLTRSPLGRATREAATALVLAATQSKLEMLADERPTLEVAFPAPTATRQRIEAWLAAHRYRQTNASDVWERRDGTVRTRVLFQEDHAYFVAD